MMLSTNLHQTLQLKAHWKRARCGASSSQHHGNRTRRPSVTALASTLQVLKEPSKTNRRPHRVGALAKDGSSSAPNEAFSVEQDVTKVIGSKDDIHKELKKFVKLWLAVLSVEMGTDCICGVHTTSQPPEACFEHTQEHDGNQIGHMMECPHGIPTTILELQQHLTSHDPDWSQRMPEILLQQAHGVVEPSIRKSSQVLHDEEEVVEVVDLVTRRSKKGSGAYQVTLLDLTEYFHLTLKDAAKALSVSVTSLKKASRKLGIPRWPGRKVRSLEAIIHGVDAMRERLGVKETKEIFDIILKVGTMLQGTRDELRCAMMHSEELARVYKRLYSYGFRST